MLGFPCSLVAPEGVDTWRIGASSLYGLSVVKGIV